MKWSAGAVDKVIQSVVNINEVKFMKDVYLHVHPVQGVGSGIIINKDGFNPTTFIQSEGIAFDIFFVIQYLSEGITYYDYLSFFLVSLFKTLHDNMKTSHSTITRTILPFLPHR